MELSFYLLSNALNGWNYIDAETDRGGSAATRNMHVDTQHNFILSAVNQRTDSRSYF
jgi:hypothetical protein